MKNSTHRDVELLTANPDAASWRRYVTDLDIKMQEKHKCKCFSNKEIYVVKKPKSNQEIANALGLDIINDIDRINDLAKKDQETSLKKLNEYDEEKIKMIATVNASLNKEALDIIVNANGYKEADEKNDPYVLFQFITDIIFYKINTNSTIRSSCELWKEIAGLKQGPTETLLTYQHRATSILDMITRTQKRFTKFLEENDYEDENIKPGKITFLYNILHGLNDSYSAFKSDVYNRMAVNKGKFPYNNISDMLNHANEFSYASVNKNGKQFINFGAINHGDVTKSKKHEKNKIKCTACNFNGHTEDQCYKKHPELRPTVTKERKEDKAEADPRPSSL